MQLYISEGDYKADQVTNRFNTVENYDESDTVLILPGGLGCVNDLLNSIKDKKKTYIYNKESYYSTFIERLQESKIGESITEMPEGAFQVEDDLEVIMEKMEEENGKVNNGKTSKLL